MAILAVVTVSGCSSAEPDITAPARGNGFELDISYGLSRHSLTRVFQLDLCGLKVTFPECTTTDGSTTSTTAPSNTSTTAATIEPPARPAVLFAGVVKDLTARDGSGRQFPASQLSVTATNEGKVGLRVSVTADPLQPEAVHAGTYEGQIGLERASGPALGVPIVVTLKSRSDRGTVSWVLACLVGGALAGYFAKYLNDFAVPLSTLRRRYSRLLRSFEPVERWLPNGVLWRFSDIRSAIRLRDSSQVAERLKELEDAVEPIYEFGEGLRALDAEVREQVRIVGEMTSRPPSFDEVRAAELRQIDDLSRTHWPWKEPDKVTQQIDGMLDTFQKVTDDLRQGAAVAAGMSVMETALGSALQTLTQLDPQQVLATAQPSVPPPSPTAVTPEHRTGRGQPRLHRSASEALLDHIGFVSLLVSVAVVVFVGYQTQYLGDHAFSGDVGEYLTLAAWAFGLELAGTTVVDVASRLRPQPPSTTASS